VTQRELLAGSELVIDPSEEVVVVLGLQHAEILGRDPQRRLRGIDQPEVVQEHRGIRRRFPAPLAFVICKKEGLVCLDGTTEGDSKLILSEHIRLRFRLEKRSSVELVVLKV